MRIHKFGNCYLNTAQRRVIKDGKYLDLTPKTFDVLLFLIKSGGEIVTKDELLGKVWNGSFVEEGNLAVQISKLRNLLDADKNEPFIETIQSSGYRFVSSVEAVGDDEWKKQFPAKSRLQNGNCSMKPVSNNSESCKIYLKGKYLSEKRTEKDLRRAVNYFEKCAAFDPLNVNFYVETAEIYLSLYVCDYISLTDVRSKIEPILSVIAALDQKKDVAQALLGKKDMYFDWKFKEAEKHFQTALTLDPQSLTVHCRYADFLLLSGKCSETLKELQEIILLDPLSVSTCRRIGRLFYKMGRYKNAVTYLKDALELEPADYTTLALLGAAFMESGKYDKALKLFRKSLRIQKNPETLAMIGCANARLGNKDEARQIIGQLTAESKNNSRYSIKIAGIYASLEEEILALEYLEQAFDQHDVDMISLRCDPRWKTINDHPRFMEIVEKVGFPYG